MSQKRISACDLYPNIVRPTYYICLSVSSQLLDSFEWMKQLFKVIVITKVPQKGILEKILDFMIR